MKDIIPYATLLGCLIVIALGAALLSPSAAPAIQNPTVAQSATTSAPVATTTVEKKPQTQTSAALTKTADAHPAAAASSTPSAADNQAFRVVNPYPFPPTSFDTINTDARGALVNIFCVQVGGALNASISGSGVIIDPRGVILTNAHVAQYILLSDITGLNMSCAIRTGSPARESWKAHVFYMPQAWVDVHAKEILEQKPLGTGENDYALLVIDGSAGSPLPMQFPFMHFETREAVAFTDDAVLVAAYPAGFLGGFEAARDLASISTVTTIKDLYTFSDASNIDVFSLGGIILAQGGSSGGAVVNQWDRLVGLIVTASSGETTSARDLRALSLAYIERSLRATIGVGLSGFLTGDISAKEIDFATNKEPQILEQFLRVIPRI